MASICVGCGLDVNGSGVLVVDLDGAGTQSGLNCSDGAGLSTAINHTDGTCVTMTGLGTLGSPLHSELNLADANSALICDGTGLRVDVSEDACNGASIRGNGLYAPCPDSLVCSVNTGNQGGLPVALNTGGGVPSFFNLLSNCTAPPSCATCVAACGTNAIQICQNGVNDICCQTSGFWEIEAYGGVISTNPGFEATVFLRECLDGVFADSQPLTNKKFFNSTGGVQIWELGSFLAKNFIVYNRGDCHTFSAAITIAVTAGTGSWIVGPNFEFYFHFTQTGCC